ncbi:putative leucine-rich repeat-containing protein DDB_G0290503 [Sitodiplosis mosellana]|uniref:putative leucine-rich repeat-containing protein DDB_G0290503 n=1 Tax=Sitodiplosis mosellana TaxID=263140 RepID=UPI002443EB08|nr:putative leucine-rich repeat-containing protein DDB_G0290503 [Sitodiplosis mosellana]
MGSTPSTPVRDRSDDPWWPIENQILDLNPNAMDTPNNSNTNSVEEQRTLPEKSEPLSNNSEKNHVDESNSIENISGSFEELSKSDIEIESSAESSANATNSETERVQQRQQSLEEFKEELRIKREMRTNAISELRNEISSLRKQLADEKELTKQLKETQNKENLCNICGSIYNSLECTAQANIATAVASTESNITLRSQLAELQFSLQNANAEILTLSSELAATKKQAKSLKEVIAASKEIIEIRETELTQLKTKLKEIENSLAERELHMMSENLRQEYDRQLANIRNLRALYEERARISAAEKENLNRQLETSRAEHSSEVEKNKNLEDHIASLDTDLKSTTTDLYATKEQLTFYKAENRDLRDEMTVVNQLFGQLLAGFNGNNNIDIDKLTLMLEENRDLLNDITSKENCKEGAAQIPKLIFDLVSQADKTTENPIVVEATVASDSPSTDSATEQSAAKVSSAQEIIHNLPKVWRVLTELLNHQQLKPVPLQEMNKGEHCYKSIQTPSGPQMVLSVSKTYIRLKDLIMEKKFLQKETKKLKNLNSHLESRLGEQEQRLGAVSIELNKTWNLVGRMQRQHRQLHTHEQVLRYQLQQKRRMLSELKEELEYCRRKWALAKEKNNESQSQWETLRLEFSKRKESDLNNSGESGYSDSPASEEDEEDSSASIEKPRSSRLKKKLNMDNFLLTTDEKDRKTIRIHSVSPVRNAKVSVTRRNSDSHITQYATEVFQPTSDVVQPIVHTVCSAECGENCVKHSVHFDAEAQKSTDQVKVSEPVIHSAKHELTNAQKLVESKATGSKTKMCCEMRQKATTSKPSTSKNEESLEDMFFRLSGDEPASEEPRSSQDNESSGSQINEPTDVPPTLAPSPEERERKRLARIERLEGQCKQLLSQVTRASNRGDDLKKRINDIHSRYTPDREALSSEKQIAPTQSESQSEPQPSTSTMESISSKSDEQCLSPTEKEYLLRRDERLKRLESESQAHMDKVKSINRRATDVDNKLEFLHGRYGNETDENGDTSGSREQTTEPQPSSPSPRVETTVVKSDEDCLSATEREYLSRRDERLKRLEAESQAHINRMRAATQRQATDVDNKLEHTSETVENAIHPTSTSNESIENASNQNDTNEPQPSSSLGIEKTEDSSKSDEQCLSSTEQEYLSRRDELEAESQVHVNRMKLVNQRATDVDSQLEHLHERYSSEMSTIETTSTTDESRDNPPNQNEDNQPTYDGSASNDDNHGPSD